MNEVNQIVGDVLSVTVNKKELIAEGVMYFELVSKSGGALPPFTAGSHIDVQLPNGLVRQYSLCGSPSITSSYEIGVLLETNGRGGSKSAHQDLELGATLQISHPKNHFPLQKAKHSILFAGGIGVTPILSMAETLTDQSASFDMHYCSRTAAKTAFIKRIQSAPFASKVQFHFDDGEDVQKLNAKEVLKNVDPDTHLYVCGPKGFMDYIIQTSKELGWPEAQVHYEFFKAEVLVKDDDGSFEVEFASTGQVVNVSADTTIAYALIEAGVAIPLSCEQGICGTCVMKVVEGVPDHRDVCLSDEDKEIKKMFTPCCSRAQSTRLVLDF